jgi:hypothetical protein
VTELLLFGVKGHLRTSAPGRRQVNIVITRKQEHSRKPDEIYPIIEACSPAPFLELFARERVKGWTQWGDEVDSYKPPPYKAYSWSTNSDRSISCPSPPKAAGIRPRPLRPPLE